jgi:hypothetical protein
MNHGRRMYEQNTAQNLVHEVLDVLVAQFLLRVDNAVKVGFHQIGYYVN